MRSPTLPTLLACLLAAACAVDTKVAWAPDVAPLQTFDRSQFPGAAALLAGFAAADAEGAAAQRGAAAQLRRGDAALFGLEVQNGGEVERRLLLLEVVEMPIEYAIDDDERLLLELREHRFVEMTWKQRDGASVSRRYRISPVSIRIRQFDADGRERSATQAEMFEETLQAGFWPLTFDEDDDLIARGLDPIDQRMMAVLLLTTVQRLGSGDPTLKKLLFELVETPSILSVIFHFGVDLSIESGSGSPGPAIAGLPGGEEIRLLPLELRINGSPALHADLALAPPRAPLAVAGGVVGAVARHPSDAGRVALLHLLATRRGPAPERPEPGSPRYKEIRMNQSSRSSSSRGSDS